MFHSDSLDLGQVLNEQLCHQLSTQVPGREGEHPRPGGEQILPLTVRTADVLVLREDHPTFG